MLGPEMVPQRRFLLVCLRAFATFVGLLDAVGGPVVDEGVFASRGVVAKVALERFMGSVYLFVAGQVALLGERQVAYVTGERSMS